jgi:ubiquitin C-terminal hydrolase
MVCMHINICCEGMNGPSTTADTSVPANNPVLYDLHGLICHSGSLHQVDIANLCRLS